MVKGLLLSAAYSWFIGLLVIMLVMAVLFIVIALFALKPYKLGDEVENGSESALKLLDQREAELAATLLKQEGEQKKQTEDKLRDVANAKKVVKELLNEGDDRSAAQSGEDGLSADDDNGEKEAIENTFNAAPAEDGEQIKKSFTAKLMQSGDNVKVWYFELKNCILCYEKTKARMGWNNEKFYIGKTNVATLTMRGKQLCLYLALNAEQYSKTFPVKASTSDMYKTATPCLFRIKNANNIKEAKELISLLMADYGVMYVRTNHSIYALPYEDDDALVVKGLAKKD